MADGGQTKRQFFSSRPNANAQELKKRVREKKKKKNSRHEIITHTSVLTKSTSLDSIYIFFPFANASDTDDLKL